MRNKLIKTVLISGSLTMLLSSCRDRNKLVEPPPPTVTVQKPVVRDVVAYSEFSGYTHAAKSVEIDARVSGVLEKMYFVPGQQVKKGDMLFLIEQSEYQAALDKANADLAKAKAEQKLAEATLIRKKNAFKDNAISEVDVLEAEANLAIAAASIKQMEAAVADAARKFSYTEIKAPIDGQISRNMVSVGNLISLPANAYLGSVVNNLKMYVYFSISEKAVLRMLNHVKKSGAGKPVPIQLGLGNEGDFPLTGELNYIDNKVDKDTGTIQLRATFKNEDNYLKDGLYARVRIASQQVKGALMVPEYAVSKNQRGSYLLVANDKNIVEVRPVELGVSDNGEVQIKKGITAEDRVITIGLLKARLNSPVNPEMTNEKAGK